MEQTKKQNVLIVHNYYQIPGGEDTVVANEKKMLEDHGHKVWLYTRNNSELKEYGKLQKLGLPFQTVFSLRTYREVKKLIRKNRIDVLHVHNTLNLISPSVYYAGFSCHIPVVQTMHNFRFLCPGAEFYRNGRICEDCVRRKGGLLCSLKHRCYRGSLLETLASALTLKLHRILGTYRRLNYICLTEFNKEKLLLLNQGNHKSGSRAMIDPEKIFVKPNFTYDVASPECIKNMQNVVSDECSGNMQNVNTDECTENIQTLVTDHTQPQSDYYIYVGRLEEIKGILLILKAFVKNKKRLVVLGTGTKEDTIKKYLERHSIANVELLGYQPRECVNEWIQGARAMIVAPQWYETFGMTVVEAFANHTPVIVGNLGNAGGLVEEGRNGWHFQYDSYESLNKVVDKVSWLTKEQRLAMGENAYEEFCTHYREEENYHMLKAIYDAVQ